jgi:hypothetical protein
MTMIAPLHRARAGRQVSEIADDRLSDFADGPIFMAFPGGFCAVSAWT